ncbi:hypothetical protein EJ357_01275 [Streptomyces cyaneochromogenes]|uniref:Uncharacterized protein n=1 Tax=Streptomyces cyaneochromogenes TaxID=2496836 RepID=A0A3Q9ENG3_9ACTN|nr:hypothetical protein [Streptomyces cyaneochromogenes]AZQ32264.1 hypothetical protein EJ357_01275 [Streptomyces cyaneochromogenes]
MYFFGAITDSQVAINSGTVTQTEVKKFTENYLRGTAQAMTEPEHGIVSRKSDPPQGPTPDPQSELTNMGVQPASVEIFCREYLLPMLNELERHIPELGLSKAAREELKQTIVGVRARVRRTPVDMKAVTDGLTLIKGALSEPQDDRAFPDDQPKAPLRGGRL